MLLSIIFNDNNSIILKKIQRIAWSIFEFDFSEFIEFEK